MRWRRCGSSPGIFTEPGSGVNPMARLRQIKSFAQKFITMSAHSRELTMQKNKLRPSVMAWTAYTALCATASQGAETPTAAPGKLEEVVVTASRTREREFDSHASLSVINEEELAKIYEFDLALLEEGEEIDRAIDNVSASIDTDGLPAAVRHLVGLTQELVTTFERRDEVLTSIE